MGELFQGIREFRETDFLEHKELFSDIGRKQVPHTLFIGCSDSRIVPNLITKTLPGELFVIRNIANLVPLYRESSEVLATTSAIEYAVQMLNVENIVICGHSNCGGCEALYFDDESLKDLPHTRRWLELARPVADMVKAKIDIKAEPEKREWLTEQLNIVQQIEHLLSYPFIRKRYEAKLINIYGWYYIIETGEIYNFDFDSRVFLKVE